MPPKYEADGGATGRTGDRLIGNSRAMTFARLHSNEKDRLDSLSSYQVLDTEPDPAVDALTRLAARVFRVPLAGVSLIDADRQWFKSMIGGPAPNVSREQSFCADVVESGRLLVVTDAAAHPRYAYFPQAQAKPGVRGYAGAPLVGREGLTLGALCVMDHRPRRFTAEQLELLISLASQVMTVLEERRRDQAAGMLEEWVPADARNPIRLRHALEAGELIPHFQPIVDVISGRTHGLEALLRWEHPELGTLPPAAFLPSIEGSALVVPVGRTMLDSALREIANLRGVGITLPGGVAVNVASGQLARPGLADDVFAALDHHGLPASQLSLEITETTAFPDPALALTELTALADGGISLVLDDFGVGWSNVSRLLDLPVSSLKLDRSLVSAMNEDPRSAFVVASAVATALELGLDVVAEGIEDEETRRHIASTGCRWAQGWLFSPAVPAATLPRMLRQPQSRPLPATALGAPPARDSPFVSSWHR